MVNNQKLLLSKDFYPLAYSASTSAEGSASPDLREAGQPWFF